MRAKYDKVCEVRRGLRTRVGLPGELVADLVPCRLVPQADIVQAQYPFDLTDAWLTLDAVSLTGPYTVTPWPGAVFTDYLSADRVIVSDHPEQGWYVCRQEQIFQHGGEPYTRYLLLAADAFETDLGPPRGEIPPSPPIVPPDPVPRIDDCNDHVPLVYGAQYSIPLDAPEGSVRWYSWLVPSGYHHLNLNLTDLAGVVAFQFGVASDCSTLTLGELVQDCFTVLVANAGRAFLRVELLDDSLPVLGVKMSEGPCV